MIQRAPTYHRSVVIEINSSVLHLKYKIHVFNLTRPENEHKTSGSA